MSFVSGVWSEALNPTNFCSGIKDKNISFLYPPFFYIVATQSNRNYTKLMVENLAALMSEFKMVDSNYFIFLFSFVIFFSFIFIFGT